MSTMKVMIVSSIIMTLLIVIPTIKALTCQCHNDDGTPGFVGPFAGPFTPFFQCYNNNDTCAQVYDAVTSSEELDCCTCCCGANNSPADFLGVTDIFETTDGCPLLELGGD